MPPKHLRPREVEYVQQPVEGKPERLYRVKVTYSHHAFTEHGPNGQREFNDVRYKQSFALPSIINGLMQRECHHTGRQNFFTIEMVGDRCYEVYFEIFKTSEGLNLRVQSAYFRDADNIRNQPRRAKVGFATILFNVKNGKPIHPPQQKNRK